ncbi:expressed unknown protein [Seminavis robusta]|uniref:Uncharacterized protein n=1 Tax=Seminavis robusta TaxID=568900 RepID=A0A9N8E8J2_9STRA|nr:expressed unknown protein [Seminavis robusta]|eukprot:Sro740_g195480.1 n/a (595) ;mRNA; r:10386-12170
MPALKSSRNINPAFLRRDRQRNVYQNTTKEVQDTTDEVNTDNDNDDGDSDGLSWNQRVSYGMASVDLSTKWMDLVQREQVAVTTTVPANNDTDNEIMIDVRYGVRLHPHIPNSFMEFVEPPASDSDNNHTTATEPMHPKIAAMNQTLQQAAGLLPEDKESTSSTGIQCRFDGPFAAQLQLVRTLRPPPSPGFGSNNAQNEEFRTTSTPPSYDASTDSFVTGPLRLALRPRVARLSLPPLTTEWDVYHNISPADVRGHFLLVPNLDDSPDINWRGQALVEADCHDLVRLTASIRPIGSLLVCFNSVGAGASQNHIHCHLWPTPPVPLLMMNEFNQQQQQQQPTDTAAKESNNDDDDDDHVHDDHDHDDHDHDHAEVENMDPSSYKAIHHGWSCYAASRVNSIVDFADIMAPCSATSSDDDEEEPESLVEVSYLDYPCFCVQLSTGSTTTPAKTVESLHAVSKALWTVLSCIGDAPHNVCMVNRPISTSSSDNNNADDNQDTASSSSNNDGCVNVDVFVFVRSRERSPNIVPASKAGASEMMGVFHCHNLQQLEELAQQQAGQKPKSPMAQVLEDVSHENPAELWDSIKEALEKEG